MENMVSEPISREALRSILDRVFNGRRVLITGHNGFVGSWLSYLLVQSGAEVTGFSLADEPISLAKSLDLSALTHAVVGDVASLKSLQDLVRDTQPEIVFHLAAQALVLPSYDDPITTWMTNVMGTANVLEAVRHAPSVRGCVVITSDKCYATADRVHVETDALGGDDPYSASKAAAEMVAHSYRHAFFDRTNVGVATARAGNIIGGGDWAAHRIVPDCVRAIQDGDAVHLRHPEAVRPWQHVLDAINGYVRLADGLLNGDTTYASAWNFGPPATAAATVGEFVQLFTSLWRKRSAISVSDPVLDGGEHVPERTILTLDSTKAHDKLAWRQLLGLTDMMDYTVEWYEEMEKSEHRAGQVVTKSQIDRYLELDENDLVATATHPTTGHQ